MCCDVWLSMKLLMKGRKDSRCRIAGTTFCVKVTKVLDNDGLYNLRLFYNGKNKIKVVFSANPRL